MERTEIIEKLTPIFQEVFEDESLALTDDQTPEKIDNWESITHMMMIEKVEKTFEFRFKFMELQQLTSVGNIVSTIQKHVG